VHALQVDRIARIGEAVREMRIDARMRGSRGFAQDGMDADDAPLRNRGSRPSRGPLQGNTVCLLAVMTNTRGSP
jgi:hypothetical protein